MSMSRTYKTKENRIREEKSKEFKKIILEFKQKGDYLKGDFSQLRNIFFIKS